MYGTVFGAQVMSDRITRQSKGFGFVQMGTDAEAHAAIVALNGRSHRGRTLTVTMAKSREDRSRSRSH
jgi:RNA recognition motif-containing protein